MVSNFIPYAPILERGVQALEAIMQLYEEDQHVHPYFVSALKDARSYRNSLLERIANPVYLRNTFEGTFFISLTHFLDNHWGDYLPDSPKSDVNKRNAIEKLRGELEEVVNEIIEVHNSLKK